MWVGAQAWRRARARGDCRRLPTPFRRKIQPTAKPPPVIVVGADNIADLEFGRLQYVCNPRCPSSTPRRSADLEFRQLQYTSERMLVGPEKPESELKRASQGGY